MSFVLLATSEEWDQSDGYWITSFLGVALVVMISLTFWRVVKRWALENSANSVYARDPADQVTQGLT